MVQERDFHVQVDQLFLKIEQELEKSQDIDFESQEGILTLFIGKNRLILSRQTSVREIWLASPLGAYHFHYSGSGWETHQNQSLLEVVVRIIKECTGIVIDL